MTEEEALIAAVCDTPGDDLPRLVYADWLDENGRPDRAEFIRVQCELARLNPRDDDHQVRLCDLRRREWQLFNRYSRVWFEADLRAAGWGAAHVILHPQSVNTSSDTVGLARGFITSARLPAAIWLGGPCERCWGDGNGRVTPHPQHMGCLTCSGTARRCGLGMKLVAGAPLTRVSLTDRAPRHATLNGSARREDGRRWFDGGWWWADSGMWVGDDCREDLPTPVFRIVSRYAAEVKGHRASSGGGQRFETEADACDALSFALIVWARIAPQLVASGVPPGEVLDYLPPRYVETAVFERELRRAGIS